MNNETKAKIQGKVTRMKRLLDRSEQILDNADAEGRKMTASELEKVNRFNVQYDELSTEVKKIIKESGSSEPGSVDDATFGKFLRGQLRTDEISISANPEPLADPEGRDFAAYLRGN